jgi:hypothetical protein
MTLHAMLLAEHSRKQCDKIVRWVGNDCLRMKMLVDVVSGNEIILQQRASWPLSYIAEANPKMLDPHLKTLLENLRKPNLHVAVKRNTMRLFQFVQIHVELHGELMDTCFRFISSPVETVAVKVFALSLLEKLCITYPEILPEIKAIVQMQWHQQTPAFKARARLFLD